MLRYKGEPTKASFMQQRLKEFQKQARGMQPKAGVSFEILKAQFQQKQAAELARKNAQEQAVIDALNNRTKQIESSASYLALAKEAGELQRRYSSSNSTEKAQLKQRALEIQASSSRWSWERKVEVGETPMDATNESNAGKEFGI